MRIDSKMNSDGNVGENTKKLAHGEHKAEPTYQNRQVLYVDIITLFPEYFDQPLQSSIIGRAAKAGKVVFRLHNLRDSAQDKHGTVDDTPYGGGPGMVLKVDVMKRAIDRIKAKGGAGETPYIILLTPQGQQLTQSISTDLAAQPWLVFICGHYEGFDERIRDYVDRELSIGPYVLSGGEPAALVAIDSVVRLIPGATGHRDSIVEESFSLRDAAGNPLLEYPHYTRPEEFEGKRVPEVLLSGHHAEIEAWRRQQAQERSQKRLGHDGQPVPATK